MTDPNSLIPISDEQAKLGQKALEVLQGLGGFLREIFGTVPEDLVGYFGGDLLKVRRAENFVRIAQEAGERLKTRGIHTPEPPSISILLPIVVASAEEIANLVKLELVHSSRPEVTAAPASITAFGREFLRAISN